MNDDRLDFTPLDPTSDPERFDRIARGIAAKALPSLRARRAGRDVWAALAGWRRPVLAAAALLVVASALVIARTPRMIAVGTALGRASSSEGLIEAAGMPSSIAGYLESGTSPEPADVLGL